MKTICYGTTSDLERGEDRVEVSDHVAVHPHSRVAVEGRRSPGDHGDVPTTPQRDRWEAGDGMDLEGRADAEHQVGSSRQRLRLRHRVGREELAEEHDVGLHRPGARRAPSGALLIEEAIDLSELKLRAAPLAARGANRAVHL